MPPGSYQQPGGPPPPNYLVWAILATIFCCLPLGIPAIVMAEGIMAVEEGTMLALDGGVGEVIVETWDTLLFSLALAVAMLLYDPTLELSAIESGQTYTTERYY